MRVQLSPLIVLLLFLEMFKFIWKIKIYVDNLISGGGFVCLSRRTETLFRLTAATGWSLGWSIIGNTAHSSALLTA